MTNFVTLTATGRYFAVYVNDNRVSQHTTEREAAERVINEKLTDIHANIFYRHEYTVVAEVTTAGVTLANDYAPAVDQPPVITSTPVITAFDFGTPGTRDLSVYVSDDGLSALTYNLTNVLPNGLSFNQNTGILSYDGVGSGTTSQHQLVAIDGAGSDTSASFDIVVTQSQLSLLNVPDITLAPTETHDMSQYWVDPLNEVVTSDIFNLDTNVATYSHPILTGKNTGTSANLTLQVSTGIPADIYVNKTGDNTDGLTEATAFNTIQSAINAASAGDVIEVQSNTAGTTQYFNEALTIPVNGADGNEITLRGRDGDTIVVYTTNSSRPAGAVIHLNGDSYWKFENLQLGRDETLNGWSYATGTANVEHAAWCVSQNGSHHITFTDCRMYGGKGYSQPHQNNYLDSGLNDHHFAFINCVGSHAGINQSVGEGNVLMFNGKHLLINGGQYKWGGHSNIEIYAPFSVVRNAICDGEWDTYSSTYRGNRAFTCEGSKGQSPWGPSLVEKCVIKNTDTDDSGPDQSAKIASKGMIFRRNWVFDNHEYDTEWGGQWAASGEASGGAAGVAATDDIHAYHNTCYNNGAILHMTDNNVGTGDGNNHYINHRYKNNIWTDIKTAGTDNGFNLRQIVYWFPKSTTPTGIRGAEWENNIIHMTDGDANLKIFVTGTGTVTTLATIESTFSGFTNNSISAPSFSNLADRTVDNIDTVEAAFTLTTGRQTAVALTQASGAGTNSTSLTVDDSLYFYCGNDASTWDMGYFGEVGDYIKIGSGSPVQITAINYTTHVITLAESRSWSDNDDVFLVDADGVTVVDDLGASQ